MKNILTLCVFSLMLMMLGCTNPPPAGPVVAYVPDAEDMLFTTDGRFFISGHNTIYEVTSDGAGGYQQALVDEGDCLYIGLEEVERWLITSCVSILRYGEIFSSRLVGFDLDNNMNRVEVGDLPGVGIANGVEVFPGTHTLFISDSNYVAPGTITRLELSFLTPTPTIANYNRNWLTPADGLSKPNGVRMSDGYLYVSDSPLVMRFLINSTGTEALSAESSLPSSRVCYL